MSASTQTHEAVTDAPTEPLAAETPLDPVRDVVVADIDVHDSKTTFAVWSAIAECSVETVARHTGEM